MLFQLFTGKLPTPDLWGWKNYWRLRKAPAKVRRLILQIIHTNPQKRIASAELAGAAFNQVQSEQRTQVLEKMVGI